VTTHVRPDSGPEPAASILAEWLALQREVSQLPPQPGRLADEKLPPILDRAQTVFYGFAVATRNQTLGLLLDQTDGRAWLNPRVLSPLTYATLSFGGLIRLIIPAPLVDCPALHERA